MSRFNRGGVKKDKRSGIKRKKHNIPDEVDLAIWQADFEKLSKGLDESGMRNPITETELVGWVRRKLDEVWMKCPQKLSFLAKMRVPDYDPDTRRASMWVCNICKGGFSNTDIQVDHRLGDHEFTKLSHLQEFADKRFMVGYDDLQCLCIPCHEVKTLSERQGISFQEATLLKKVIALEKAKGVQSFLEANGVEAAGNAKLRRNQAIELLTEMEKHYETNN